MWRPSAKKTRRKEEVAVSAGGARCVHSRSSALNWRRCTFAGMCACCEDVNLRVCTCAAYVRVHMPSRLVCVCVQHYMLRAAAAVNCSSYLANPTPGFHSGMHRCLAETSHSERVRAGSRAPLPTRVCLQIPRGCLPSLRRPEATASSKRPNRGGADVHAHLRCICRAAEAQARQGRAQCVCEGSARTVSERRRHKGVQKQGCKKIRKRMGGKRTYRAAQPSRSPRHQISSGRNGNVTRRRRLSGGDRMRVTLTLQTLQTWCKMIK